MPSSKIEGIVTARAAGSFLRRGFGLARVETVLEVAANTLAAREHGLVAHSAGRQFHDPDVIVALSVAASVCRGLVVGPKAVALPLSPHSGGPLAEAGAKGNPHPGAVSAVCDEKDEPVARSRNRSRSGL